MIIFNPEKFLIKLFSKDIRVLNKPFSTDGNFSKNTQTLLQSETISRISNQKWEKMITKWCFMYCITIIYYTIQVTYQCNLYFV